MSMALLDNDHGHDERISRLGFCSECEAAKVMARLGPELVEGASEFQPDLFGGLEGDVAKVAEHLADGRWHTLREISAATGIPEPSVSARLRDLRKDAFGGHTIEREGTGNRSVRKYRLVPPSFVPRVVD